MERCRHHHQGDGAAEEIVYPHAEDVRMIRAARRVTDEGIGGGVASVTPVALIVMQQDVGISIDGIEGSRLPKQEAERDRHASSSSSRAGQGPVTSGRPGGRPRIRQVRCLMVREGAADAVIGA